MSRDQPLLDLECDQLFTGLGHYRLLLVAVSGGADSTALMHLLARWHRRRGSTSQQLHVATVDHALRPESRAEAGAVAAAAQDLGLPHHVLTWTAPKPAAGLQDAARSARYALLAQLLRDLGETNAAVVSAHTADDQAETLLMRLARGSGLDGLSAMSPCRRLSAGEPYDLVRPLLDVPKSRLVATLRSDGITWSEDPSNARTDFERVRIRAAAETLAALGLTPDKLALSAHRLRRARSAVAITAAEFETRVLDLNGGAFAAVRRSEFAGAPAELRLRLLLRVLARFGGTSPPARLSKVEALLDRLGHDAGFTATLGGCVVTANAASLRIFREPGRNPLPECLLRDASPVLWDARFAVSVGGLPPEHGAVTVKALGTPGYATLRQSTPVRLPQKAAATLPSFWSGDTLLAVPVLAPGRQVGLERPEFTFRTEFLGLPDDARNCD
ncbi:MAG: tRNA lysidine(34) synthetase TilS [Hyphomicrobiaceae bacterium]|nr:tRNA lysidine(34) synthetase TilS [Hyphomicrobiaceae bacterium]